MLPVKQAYIIPLLIDTQNVGARPCNSLMPPLITKTTELTRMVKVLQDSIRVVTEA